MKSNLSFQTIGGPGTEIACGSKRDTLIARRSRSTCTTHSLKHTPTPLLAEEVHDRNGPRLWRGTRGVGGGGGEVSPEEIV